MGLVFICPRLPSDTMASGMALLLLRKSDGKRCGDEEGERGRAREVMRKGDRDERQCVCV